MSEYVKSKKPVAEVAEKKTLQEAFRKLSLEKRLLVAVEILNRGVPLAVAERALAFRYVDLNEDAKKDLDQARAQALSSLYSVAYDAAMEPDPKLALALLELLDPQPRAKAPQNASSAEQSGGLALTVEQMEEIVKARAAK